MKQAWIALGVLMLAAGCTSPYEAQQPPPAAAPASPPPTAALPSAPAPVPPPSQDADACGAAALQSLVGRPRTEIPVPVDPNRQRVACTACPITQDYRPERLNIFFDAQTGIIKQVRCG